MTTFIIAELGINHNGSIELGRKTIDAAKAAGVHAVKFQTYLPELRFKKGNPFTSIFEEYHLDFDEEYKLWEHAQSLGLKVLTTPFDLPSVEFCRTSQLDGIKIASFETTNLELVRAVASLNQPTYFSTGQNTIEEVHTVIETIAKHHEKIIPMHCISSYPMKESDANLSVLNRLKQSLNRDIGFSDHSTGHVVAGFAVAMGAVCVEKHFTLDNDLPGPDHGFSMNPNSMQALVEHIEMVESIMGDSWMGVRECEQAIHDIARRVTN